MRRRRSTGRAPADGREQPRCRPAQEPLCRESSSRRQFMRQRERGKAHPRRMSHALREYPGDLRSARAGSGCADRRGDRAHSWRAPLFGRRQRTAALPAPRRSSRPARSRAGAADWKSSSVRRMAALIPACPAAGFCPQRNHQHWPGVRQACAQIADEGAPGCR